MSIRLSIQKMNSNTVRPLYLFSGIILSFISNMFLFPSLRFFKVITPSTPAMEMLLWSLMSIVFSVLLTRAIVLRIWSEPLSGFWVATHFLSENDEPSFLLIKIDMYMKRRKIFMIQGEELNSLDTPRLISSFLSEGSPVIPEFQARCRILAIDEARVLSGMSKKFVPQDTPSILISKIDYTRNPSYGFEIPYNQDLGAGGLRGVLRFNGTSEPISGTDWSDTSSGAILGPGTILLLRIPAFRDFMVLVDSEGPRTLDI